MFSFQVFILHFASATPCYNEKFSKLVKRKTSLLKRKGSIRDRFVLDLEPCFVVKICRDDTGEGKKR